MHGAELTRFLPHQDVGGADIILHPCKGGHCIVVPPNGPGYLNTKVVEYSPALRVLDDELEELHGRIGQASGGFDEKDGLVIRIVFEEVPRTGRYRACLSAVRICWTQETPGVAGMGTP